MTLAGVLAPVDASAQAVADIAWLLFAGTGYILAGVMLLLWQAVRRPAGPVRPMRWLVGAGVLFPLLVLAGLHAWTHWHTAALREPPPAQALVIGVRAHMWWWELRYPHPAGGADIVSANEIRVPVGRSVHLGLSSADVVHSAWIPALGGKMDAVPGRVNHLVFKAERSGVFDGVCAEFCGAQHARMALRVVAMPPEDFDRWLLAQAGPASPAAGAAQHRGETAYLAARCDACHTVRGVGEAGTAGPDLTRVAGRSWLGAGALEGGEAAAFERWLVDVQTLKPGARMPAYGHLDAPARRALAAWLAQLR